MRPDFSERKQLHGGDVFFAFPDNGAFIWIPVQIILGFVSPNGLKSGMPEQPGFGLPLSCLPCRSRRGLR